MEEYSYPRKYNVSIIFESNNPIKGAVMHKKVISPILTLFASVMFTGCLFEEVDQPTELEIGSQFTTVLNINSIAQEVSNPHHGIVGIMHPNGWVFESGSFESNDAETPSGLMELDPDSGKKILCSEEQYNADSCPSLDDVVERPEDMEWTFLVSDVGDYYQEQTLFEVTLSFNTDSSLAGEFPLGYITTVNAFGMIDWLNTEDNADNPNMTDTSMNHMITMLDATAGLGDNISLPSSFHLSQNYPNPFNPATRIEFSLPIAGDVSLSIFDIKGNLVENVISDRMQPGTHHVLYTPENIGSGIYYYALKTSGKSTSKKMTFIK